MTSRQNLRPYQQEALDGIRAEFRQGHRRVLLVLPTGGGKTTVAAELIHLTTARGNKVMFVAHRKELIDQASQRLDQFGVPHGVIMANHPRWMPWLPTQVASVQTLAARRNHPDVVSLEPSVIIIDEAHRARARTYLDLVERYPQAYTLGLTATPWRADGRPLDDLFDSAVVAATPRQLSEAGYLVPCTGFTFGTPDLQDIRIRRGDYDEGELASRMNRREINGELVARWFERANGLRTIAFAVNVEHSRAVVEEFRLAGVSAEHIDGSTPKAEREAILARLASGETLVVSNVGVLTEGFDCPALACCILARPTKSEGLALQMIGRIRRPAPGKNLAHIHDHAGVLATHGLPDEDRDWSLRPAPKKRGPKNTGPAVRQCPQCLAACALGALACPQCEYAFPREERELHMVSGGLIELDELQELRRASTEEKAAEYRRLLSVAERMGYARGWAAHEYRGTFGVWPRFAAGVLESVRPATKPPISLEKLRRLRNQQEVA